MSKIVGKVTETERDMILSLFERRNGLQELAKILTVENTDLYEKMVKDLGETSIKFQKWWDEMYEKYKWDRTENGNWSINFSTCEITLEG